MIPNDKDLWSNYGETVDKGYDSATQFLNDEPEQDLKAHFRVLAGWGLSLSQRFLLVYTHHCRAIIDMLPEHADQPTLAQLLSKMGIDAKNERLFDRCVKYKNGEDDLVGIWNIKLADSIVQMDFDEILFERPLQIKITDSESKQTTMCKTGAGWDDKTHINWFDKTLDAKKFINKKPPPLARRIKTLTEAQESIWINRTLSKVRLDYDNDFGRVYSMICDVKNFIDKDPTLLTGPHKIFFNNPEFECSHQMIRSLPFQFVNKLVEGVATDLPRDYIKSIRRDVLNAECNHIRSITLWRSIAHLDVFKKRNPMTKSLIYRVETEDVAVSRKTSTKTVYMSGKDATLALKTEPWIVDTVSSLPQVHSYRKVMFGDGAKLKTDSSDKSDDVLKAMVDTIACGPKNYWYDSDNFAKWCTEGSVINLVCQLLSTDEADRFKNIAVLPNDALLSAMEVDKFPKNVQSKQNRIDPIEKCVWILEKKFKCRRSMYLNAEQFRTAELTVKHLGMISFPVIISILGVQSSYNHVVVVWKKMIIDFENEYPYSLSVDNLNKLAGKNNRFHKLVCGVGILPSITMKKKHNDKGDWGEGDMKTELRHLFKKKERRY